MEMDVIRLDRLILNVFVAFFAITAFLANISVSAEGNIDNIVNARFEISVSDGTNFDIDIYMDVTRAVAFGEVYDNNEVKSLVESTDSDDLEALGVIKNYLHESSFAHIRNIFGNDAVSALMNKPVFEDNHFRDSYSVNLTYDFFDINESINAYSFVNGVLDMGANVTYDLNLYAENGWNNTYIFVLSEEIGLSYADTTNVNLENTQITWVLNNYDGSNQEEEAVLKIHNKNPSFIQSEKEDVFLNFGLYAETPKKTYLEITMDIYSTDIETYGVVPDFVERLRYISSDGIRLFVDNSIISWDIFKEKTLDNISSKIVEKLETDVFNQSVDLDFDWNNQTTSECINPYDVKNMNSDPTIQTKLKDTDLDIKIYDTSLQAVFGLVNSGATVNLTEECINFGEKIGEIGYNYNVSLFMPERIHVQNQNPYIWNESIGLTGNLASEKPPDYNEEQINTVIEVEIENTDLSLLSFFTGDPELSFGLKMTQEKAYNVTRLPEVFTLPEKIDIDFLNSDALRVCIQEEVFGQEAVDAFLTNDKTGFAKIAKNLVENVEVNANIDREFFEESLVWDEDITHMGKEDAVKTSSYSYTTQPIKFDVSIAPPGIEIPMQKYSFSGIENQTVTYRIIFPNGVNIDIDDDYGKAEIKQTKDEKKILEITFSKEEHNISIDIGCEINPSALFVIGLFMPCIISITITIIILIVLIIFRKKRKGRGPKRQREPVYEERDAGYEDQDYYIPPPPGSK